MTICLKHVMVSCIYSDNLPEACYGELYIYSDVSYTVVKSYVSKQLMAISCRN